MDSEEREPDTTDAGIGRDVGQGYPEEQPPGASPHEESPPRSGGQSGERAPKSKPESDAEPGQATGNPDAAG
ncbi:MAG: hypothetical protein E6G10_10490 [Actinobacteria bacterium]|nr:MAG: hypothetical protein E6G10_10490 [Actinomycetota bacterium]